MKRSRIIMCAAAAAGATARKVPKAPTFQDGVPFIRKERSVARTVSSFVERRASIMTNVDTKEAAKVLASNRKFEELSQTAGLVPTDEIIFSLITMNANVKQFEVVGELFAQLVREGRFPIPPHLLGAAMETVRHVAQHIPTDQAWVQKYAEDLALFLPRSQLAPADVQRSVTQLLLPLVDGLCQMGILVDPSSLSSSSEKLSAPQQKAFAEDYGYLFSDAKLSETFRELLVEVAIAASMLGNVHLLGVAAASVNVHMDRFASETAFLDDVAQLILIGAAHLPAEPSCADEASTLLDLCSGSAGEGAQSLATLAPTLPKADAYVQVVVAKDFGAADAFAAKAHELLTEEEFNLFGWLHRCSTAALDEDASALLLLVSDERTAQHRELLEAMASAEHKHLGSSSCEERVESLDQLMSQVVEGYCALIRRHLAAANACVVAATATEDPSAAAAAANAVEDNAEIDDSSLDGAVGGSGSEEEQHEEEASSATTAAATAQGDEDEFGGDAAEDQQDSSDEQQFNDSGEDIDVQEDADDQHPHPDDEAAGDSASATAAAAPSSSSTMTPQHHLSEAAAIHRHFVDAELPQLMEFAAAQRDALASQSGTSDEGSASSVPPASVFGARALQALSKLALVVDASAKNVAAALPRPLPTVVAEDDADDGDMDENAEERRLLRDVGELNAKVINGLVAATNLSAAELDALVLPKNSDRRSFVFTLVAESLIAGRRVAELENLARWIVSQDGSDVSVALGPTTYAAAMELAVQEGVPSLSAVLKDSRWRMAHWDPLK